MATKCDGVIVNRAPHPHERLGTARRLLARAATTLPIEQSVDGHDGHAAAQREKVGSESEGRRQSGDWNRGEINGRKNTPLAFVRIVLDLVRTSRRHIDVAEREEPAPTVSGDFPRPCAAGIHLVRRDVEARPPSRSVDVALAKSETESAVALTQCEISPASVHSERHTQGGDHLSRWGWPRTLFDAQIF